MMTMKQVEEWCYKHRLMKCSLEYNRDSGTKMVFENGDTYEFMYTDMQQLFKPYQIKINGEIVYQGKQTA